MTVPRSMGVGYHYTRGHNSKRNGLLSRKKIMSSQFRHTWEKLHEHSHVWATVKPVDFIQELFCANSAEGQFPATGPAGQTQRCQSSHTCRVYSRACTHLSSWYISPLCHCQIFLSVRYRRPRKRPHHFTCQPVSKHSKKRDQLDGLEWGR